MLNTIAQINLRAEDLSISRITPFHSQIRIVDTPQDRFATEIVANAIEIAGNGRRVLVVQLLKGGIRQGHDRITNLAQNLDWIRCNSLRQISSPDLDELELQSFQQLWQHVREIVSLGEYSLVILDELSRSIELGLITVESALNFLTQLPDDVEIVLTGTSSHPAILELVTND